MSDVVAKDAAMQYYNLLYILLSQTVEARLNKNVEWWFQLLDSIYSRYGCTFSPEERDRVKALLDQARDHIFNDYSDIGTLPHDLRDSIVMEELSRLEPIMNQALYDKGLLLPLKRDVAVNINARN